MDGKSNGNSVPGSQDERCSSFLEGQGLHSNTMRQFPCHITDKTSAMRHNPNLERENDACSKQYRLIILPELWQWQYVARANK